MRLASFAIAAALVSTAAVAAPVNLVQNGSFETVTATPDFEFGASYAANLNAVTDWSSPSANAYNLLYSPTIAWTPAGNAQGRFTYTGQEYLRGSGTASPDGGNFVAIDGDPSFNGPLQQTINGLTAGKTYTLSFYWAADQVASRTGPTTEQIQSSIGSDTFLTSVINNNTDPTNGSTFTGWQKWSTTFTASGSSELLSFLSLGTPSGLPPIALIDGISITQNVPEPGALALLGLGGLGLAAVARRRK